MSKQQTANDLLASTASWTASVRAQENARAGKVVLSAEEVAAMDAILARQELGTRN